MHLLQGIHIHYAATMLLAWGLPLVGLITSASAQNLVPNPSFEIYDHCPPPTLGIGGPLEAIPWISAGPGTADYFNGCADPMWRGVPYNFQGYQPAHSGIGYAGIYFRTDVGSYREYIQAQLLQPLVAGVCYKVGFWINNANESCGCNQVGAVLTDFNIGSPLGMNPDVNWGGSFYSDTVEWVYIFDFYTANGGEEYITIGNCYNDANTQLTPGCIGPPYAYYYIDDVGVEEVPMESFTIDLGPPVAVCDSFIIDPGNPDYVYHWSTGATGPTLTVYNSGTYSVTVNYGCTQEFDDIEVTILHSTQVNIGPPAVLICENDSYDISLDPDAGNYEWQDGSTDPDYSITTPGIYMVTLDDGCSISSDTIEVSLTYLPLAFSLGNDTLLCDGEGFTIDLDPSLGDFEWQDGSNDPFYTISNEGTYSLTISNMCGEETDDIDVEVIIPPMVTLGPDTAYLCGNDVLEYDFDPDQGDYVWDDGSTQPSYTISTTGNFGLTVTNICGIASDEIYVLQDEIPYVDLGPDQQACPGDIIILDAGFNTGTIEWQDGYTGIQYEVTASGNYQVTVTNGCGTDADNVIITFNNLISPPDLGPDFSLCPGGQFTLHASSPGASYLWSDMSTADTLLVNAAGTYYVQVYNPCDSYTDTVVVSMTNNPPVVQLPPDFTLCTGQTSILDPGLSGVSYLWSDGSMMPTFTVAGPGMYALTVSNACGSSIDTVLVGAGDIAPSVELGMDTSLCNGDTVLLLPVYDHVDTWLWHDGSTADQFIATTPGIVQVMVSNTCGSAFDTVMVGLLPATPPLDLGSDTAVCPGEMVTLSIAIPGVNILWSDGSTGNNLIVTDSATVFATISNVCGSAMDSVTISLLPQTPPLDLGPDQTICPGELVTFSPGTSGVTYLWHDGSTNPDYQTTNEEVIYLTISNVCGFSSDTVVLTESTNGPQLDLGPDLFACAGEIITIQSGISGVQYLWQDGSTGNAYVTTQSGVYSLTVTNSCGTDVDSMEVEFTAAPLAQDLGPDSTLCEGEELLLSAIASIGIQITWQDQSTGTTYVVTAPGTYSITASNQCGVSRDTVEVSFIKSPDPFTLGPDTTICAGETVLLSSPSSFYDVLWQDGSGMLHLIADHTGRYWLRLSNECGSTADTIDINVDSRTPTVTLAPELLWCQGDQFTLDATQPFAATYLWTTGSTSSSINVNTPGLYAVDVKTTCAQASGQSDVVPDEDCFDEPVFYIPNVFSPDGNGVNDVFTVLTNLPDNVLGMRGSIFDRWGNLVFGSEDNPFTWNGNLNDEPMNPGVYVYVVHVTYMSSSGEVEKTFSGDVTVLR